MAYQPKHRDGSEFREWLEDQIDLYGREGVMLCLDCAISTLRDWRSGRTTPRHSMCERIGQAFGMPKSEIEWLSGLLPLEYDDWDFELGAPKRKIIEELFEKDCTIRSVSRALHVGQERARRWLMLYDLYDETLYQAPVPEKIELEEPNEQTRKSILMIYGNGDTRTGLQNLKAMLS